MEFGYWNIRGLGAPFRMIFEYKEIKYEDKQYRGHPVVPLRPFYPGGPLSKLKQAVLMYYMESLVNPKP